MSVLLMAPVPGSGYAQGGGTGPPLQHLDDFALGPEDRPRSVVVPPAGKASTTPRKPTRNSIAPNQYSTPRNSFYVSTTTTVTSRDAPTPRAGTTPRPATVMPSSVSVPTPARAGAQQKTIATNSGVRPPAVTTAPPAVTTTLRQGVQWSRQRSQTELGTTSIGIEACERLDRILSPGDVLCVTGTATGIMRLGATGGYMGHVLLVTAPPRGVHRHTPEALVFQGVWPEHHDARVLWLVRTMESTRNQEGFHESEHLLYVDDKTGKILAVAEEHHNQFLRFEHPERVDVWRCPPALRKCFRFDIMNTVLADMRQYESNWSWSTAVRAFLFSSKVPDDSRKAMERADSLQAIQQCWFADPICSSLVVVFWQRYLCLLADMYNSNPGPNTTEVDALDWILQWMPLKSDRALPGELLETMQQCGWVLVSRAPQASRPRITTI